MDENQAVVISIEDRARAWGLSRATARSVVEKTLSQRIREASGNGNDIIAILMEIMNGGKEDRDRIKAAELLLDRAYGRAVVPVVNLNDAAQMVASKYGLDPAELATAAEAMWRVQSAGEAVEALPEPAQQPDAT